MALVMVFWIGEPVPLPVTSLLGPALAVLLGISRARDAFAPFGDPVIFLFLGSFLLAEALRVHGLDRRIALAILAAPGVAALARAPAHRGRPRHRRHLDVDQQHRDRGHDAAHRARPRARAGRRGLDGIAARAAAHRRAWRRRWAAWRRRWARRRT